MSAALLTVQAALLILWAELITAFGSATPQVIGGIRVAGMVTGGFAIRRAWALR